MQNCATQCNALRKRNYELPRDSNDMQSSETLCNSLGLNHKSAAVDQHPGKLRLNSLLSLSLPFFVEVPQTVVKFGA
jgi:hypothetical protein